MRRPVEAELLFELFDKARIKPLRAAVFARPAAAFLNRPVPGEIAAAAAETVAVGIAG